ncbi:MAG: hypothetical protein IJ213_02015 [Bacteroidales bacterium]|nr:hypothetical protein [Bacteroidales bacterium]
MTKFVKNITKMLLILVSLLVVIDSFATNDTNINITTQNYYSVSNISKNTLCNISTTNAITYNISTTYDCKINVNNFLILYPKTKKTLYQTAIIHLNTRLLYPLFAHILYRTPISTP